MKEATKTIDLIQSGKLSAGSLCDRVDQARSALFAFRECENIGPIARDLFATLSFTDSVGPPLDPANGSAVGLGVFLGHRTTRAYEDVSRGCEGRQESIQ